MSKSKKTPASDLTSFRAAYEVLQKHANQLRTQTEPNIDDLLTLVNESVEAYKVCKVRIDAVEKALQEALDDPELSELMQDTDAQGQEQDDLPGKPDEGDTLVDLDDDIPF